MNLSRAAKKFRQMELKPITARKNAKTPVAEPPKPVEQVEPIPVVEPPEPVAVEPVVLEVMEAAAPLPQPKRPRFVRPQTEKRQRVALAPLVSSNKPGVRLLMKNLFLVPKEPGKVR